MENPAAAGQRDMAPALCCSPTGSTCRDRTPGSRPQPDHGQGRAAGMGRTSRPGATHDAAVARSERLILALPHLGAELGASSAQLWIADIYVFMTAGFVSVSGLAVAASGHVVLTQGGQVGGLAGLLVGVIVVHAGIGPRGCADRPAHPRRSTHGTELVEERRKGNRTERVLRASAASYVISPSVLAAAQPDPAHPASARGRRRASRPRPAGPAAGNRPPARIVSL